MEGAHLVDGGLADARAPGPVPGAPRPDGLRERRWRAEPRHAVQRLGAGAERGEAQPRHGGLVLVQQRDPLVEREPVEQIVDALAHVQLGVVERQPSGGGQG